MAYESWFATGAKANMRTIEQAKYWINQQRAQLGNPRITSVQAYLGDSMETVSVYAEVENQVEINGDLPLVAGFDLPAPITEKQFELMRETIEQQFQDRNTVTTQ